MISGDRDRFDVFEVLIPGALRPGQELLDCPKVVPNNSQSGRSRLTGAGTQMPECEHLNPQLFEASDHAIYRTRKSAKSTREPRVVAPY